jgi:hypothetical protein
MDRNQLIAEINRRLELFGREFKAGRPANYPHDLIREAMQRH